MKPYGQKKTGSHKIHGHYCGTCAPDNGNPARARQEAKQSCRKIFTDDITADVGNATAADQGQTTNLKLEE